MKRIIVFFVGLLSIVVGYSQTKTTYYYDSNWKGVEDPSFATYYRTAMVSRDKRYANKFRDYYCSSNVMIREGSYISIDKFDDSSTVFTDIVTSYYDNGKVKSTAEYDNGLLEGELVTYYEDGQLLSKEYFIKGKRNRVSSFFYNNGAPQAEIEYIEDEILGKYVTFDEHSRPLLFGIVSDGAFSGTASTYDEVGKSSEINYRYDILDGPAKFYENGQLFAALNYMNGLLDGRCIWYDSMGHAIKEVEYKKGIKVGKYVNRGNGSNIETRNYQLICSQDTFGASIAICAGVYSVQKYVVINTVKDKISNNKILNGYDSREYYTCEFPIEIMNNGKDDISCTITNIVVDYSYKGKRSDNIAIPEANSMLLYTAEADYQKRIADYNAKSNAKSAATVSGESNTITKTRGNAFGHSSAGVGSIIGDNSIKSGSFVHGGARTKEASTSSYIDGLTQYQIYQEEKVKSDAYKDQINMSLTEKAEQNNYSSFTAVSGILTQKVIVASWPKTDKFDSITVSFKLNGIPYSCSWGTLDNKE